MKTCKKCGIPRDFGEFPIDKHRPGGLHPYCKKCKREEGKDRNLINLRLRAVSKGRKCWRCFVEKPLSEFELVGSRKRRFICNACTDLQKEKDSQKECDRQKRRLALTESSRAMRLFNQRRQRKMDLIESLGSKCVDCGLIPSDVWPPACFDLHHVNGKKEFMIGRLLNGSVSHFEKVIAEAKKCILLCSNCHRRRHYDESRKRLEEKNR